VKLNVHRPAALVVPFVGAKLPPKLDDKTTVARKNGFELYRTLTVIFDVVSELTELGTAVT
jgi:hypothetical protein